MVEFVFVPEGLDKEEEYVDEFLVLEFVDDGDCVVADEVEYGEGVLLLVVGEVEGEVAGEQVESVSLVDLLPLAQQLLQLTLLVVLLRQRVQEVGKVFPILHKVVSELEERLFVSRLYLDPETL